MIGINLHDDRHLPFCLGLRQLIFEVVSTTNLFGAVKPTTSLLVLNDGPVCALAGYLPLYVRQVFGVDALEFLSLGWVCGIVHNPFTARRWGGVFLIRFGA